MTPDDATRLAEIELILCRCGKGTCHDYEFIEACAIARRAMEEKEAVRLEANLLFDRVKEQRERAEKAEELAEARLLSMNAWGRMYERRGQRLDELEKERDAARAELKAVHKGGCHGIEERERARANKAESDLARLREALYDAAAYAHAGYSHGDEWPDEDKGFLECTRENCKRWQAALAGAEKATSGEGQAKGATAHPNTPAPAAEKPAKARCSTCGASFATGGICSFDPRHTPTPPEECPGLTRIPLGVGDAAIFMHDAKHCPACPSRRPRA